jgi:hypothetical protein
MTLVVEREQLRAAIGFRPELAEEVIATIIGKAESTTQRLVEMLHMPAELRVLRALLSMATLEETSSPHGSPRTNSRASPQRPDRPPTVCCARRRSGARSHFDAVR